MPEMHLKQRRFTYSACLVKNLLKTKKEVKNLKKQEMRAIFTKMNFIRHSFSTIWLMGILKI